VARQWDPQIAAIYYDQMVIGIGGRPSRPPPTPPDMRVRIRRFG